MKRGIVISFIILMMLMGCIPQQDAERKTITSDNFSQYFDWNVSCQIQKTNDTKQPVGVGVDFTTIFWPKAIYAFSSVKVAYQINIPTAEDKEGICYLEEELFLRKNESTIQTYSKMWTEEALPLISEPTMKILAVSGELILGRYPSQLVGAHSEHDKQALSQKLEWLQKNGLNQRVHIESNVDIYKRDRDNAMDVQKDRNHYIIDDHKKYVRIDNEALYPLEGRYVIDINHKVYPTSAFVFESYQNYIYDWLDLYFSTQSLGHVIYQDNCYISTTILNDQELKAFKQWNYLCRCLEVPIYDYQDVLCTRQYHFTEEGVEVHFNVNLQKNQGIYHQAVIDIVAYIDFFASTANI